jgi:spermidine synthase
MPGEAVTGKADGAGKTTFAESMALAKTQNPAHTGSSMQGTFPVIFIGFLFFLSGFCNLVFEVVWTRMFNLVFGVTVFAVSAVLAAFMLGMAAGGVIFGRLADTAKNNCATFAFVHIGIACSAALLLAVFPLLGPVYLAVYGAVGQSFFAYRAIIFILALLLIIVPTTLMGATFPVAVRMLAVAKDRRGRDIGTLYSVNTLGGVAGCMTAIFILLGPMGMNGTALVAAGADLAIGLAALSAVRAFKPENGTV